MNRLLFVACVLFAPLAHADTINVTDHGIVPGKDVTYPLTRLLQSVRGKSDVTLSSVETFGHGKGRFTIWLNPEPTEPLLDLHAALWTAVSHEQDFQLRIGRFVPHLSIGQVRGRAERDRLVAELQTAWIPLTFPLSSVQFISRGNPPDDVFQVIRTIRLGKEAE